MKLWLAGFSSYSGEESDCGTSHVLVIAARTEGDARCVVDEYINCQSDNETHGAEQVAGREKIRLIGTADKSVARGIVLAFCEQGGGIEGRIGSGQEIHLAD